MKRLIVLILLGGCLWGAVSLMRPTPLVFDSFAGSAIDDRFPVPSQAQLTPVQSKNPDLLYVRYQMNGLEEIQSIPLPYLEEIKRRGWHEKQEEQMGAMRVFEKDGTILFMTVHDDFFTLFQRK